MLERLMERYRGTRGILGWIILQIDIRYLRSIAKRGRATSLREMQEAASIAMKHLRNL